MKAHLLDEALGVSISITLSVSLLLIIAVEHFDNSSEDEVLYLTDSEKGNSSDHGASRSNTVFPLRLTDHTARKHFAGRDKHASSTEPNHDVLDWTDLTDSETEPSKTEGVGHFTRNFERHSPPHSIHACWDECKRD